MVMALSFRNRLLALLGVPFPHGLPGLAPHGGPALGAFESRQNAQAAQVSAFGDALTGVTPTMDPLTGAPGPDRAAIGLRAERAAAPGRRL